MNENINTIQTVPQGRVNKFAIILKSPIISASVILAVGFILCSALASYTFYKIRTMDNVLSVTGSAKQAIVSDNAKWTVSVSRSVNALNINAGYADMARDLATVKAYFAKNGFAESDLNISTVYMDEVYENQPNPNAPKKYTLRQQVELASKDIQKVDTLSKNVQEIVSQGVFVSSQAPQYFYSDLATLRVKLLAEALKDAEERAGSIASVSGNKVGKLKSAASGVVQVLPPGSVEVSDYGTYDTMSINKEIMVTARATFSLK